MSYWLSIIQLVEKLKVGCQACAAVGVLFSGQCDISHTQDSILGCLATG